jgi:hypothetical protein
MVDAGQGTTTLDSRCVQHAYCPAQGKEGRGGGISQVGIVHSSAGCFRPCCARDRTGCNWQQPLLATPHPWRKLPTAVLHGIDNTLYIDEAPRVVEGGGRLSGVRIAWHQLVIVFSFGGSGVQLLGHMYICTHCNGCQQLGWLPIISITTFFCSGEAGAGGRRLGCVCRRCR